MKGWRGAAPLTLSLALHGIIAAALLVWPFMGRLDPPQEVEGIALVFAGTQDMNGDAAPEAAEELSPPEAPPPITPVAEAPPPVPPPPTEATAPPPPAPEAPPLIATDSVAQPFDLPPPPQAPSEAPPMDAPVQEQAETPPPEPSPPVAEPPRQLADSRPPPRPPAPRPPVASAAPSPIRLDAGLAERPNPFAAEGQLVPPEPLDHTQNRRPDYPAASRQRGEQGVVTVQLAIAVDGRVLAVEIIASSGFPRLDAEARKAMMEWRFRPATRNGIAVAGSIRTSVHFRLDSARR